MPLRPELFRRLKDKFRHVVIANEGQEMVAKYEPDIYGRMSMKLIVNGEQYRVSCPFCNDVRKRLWISYKWGLWDEVTQTHNLWLCVCYNEGCLKDFERKKSLYSEVFNPMQFSDAEDVVLPGVIEEQRFDKPAVMPGQIVAVNQLPKNHEAATYLTGRGFDLDQLTKDFNVGYCYDAAPEMPMAVGRIFIPVYREGIMVGWQARVVGTPWNKFIPKYYSMPGWRRGHHIYNYDRAKMFNHVVICEGPTDVWRYGPEAVCLFGKVPTPMQIKTLIDTWPIHIIMLDSDVTDGEIEGICNRLDQFGELNKRVIVKLPPGQDPGSMDVSYMRSLVNALATDKGLTLIPR